MPVNFTRRACKLNLRIILDTTFSPNGAKQVCKADSSIEIMAYKERKNAENRRDFGVFGVPERIRTSGLPLRKKLRR